MHSELIATLLRLVLIWSDYAQPETLPPVEFVKPAEMPCNCLGFFIYAQRYSGYEGDGVRPARLMLREDVDLDTDYGQSILLHELVHAVQAQRGPAAFGTSRWHRREQEAYGIQYRFLRSRGLSGYQVVGDSRVFQ